MNDQQPEEDTAHTLAERFAKLSPEKRTLLRNRLASEQLPGPEIVALSLKECGITHIYGVAGLPTQEILPTCRRQNIRPIGVYHQTSAVCMALAQNYQAGRLVAAALTSAGPAATNTITGLLVAKDNGWPVIVLGGQKSSFQKLDVIPLVRHVTKKAFVASSPGEIRNCIVEAYNIAVSGRPGPVYIQLHEDALTGHSSVSQVPSIATGQSEPRPADGAIQRIVDSVISAKRPALLLGEGIRWSVDPEKLRELIDILGIPFIASPMGRGFVAEDHPLCFNDARTALQAEADFVIILGARLNWIFRHGSEISRNAHVIRIDFEGDEEDEPVIEHEFIQCDPGGVVLQLLDAAKARLENPENMSRKRRTKIWHDQLLGVAYQTRCRLDEKMDCASKNPMSMYRMMKEVRDALPREAICITDGNVSMMVAQHVIPTYSPAGRMDPGTSGCMGVGIPFGIGAKIACPDRPVVAIVGDYGFSLSAMEMEACVRHKIPIVVIVANNQGNSGAIKQAAMFPEEDELVTMFSPGLEYDRIMELFGGIGTLVTDPDMLKPTIQKAIANGRPACINVVIDPHTPIPNAWGEQSSYTPAQ